MKTYGKGSARRKENAAAVRANWDEIRWGKSKKIDTAPLADKRANGHHPNPRT